MNRAAFWLLLPIAIVAILILGTISLVVLAFMPPVVSIMAGIVLVIVALWFIFARRAGGRLPVSEGSLMGRQKSVEGLL